MEQDRINKLNGIESLGIMGYWNQFHPGTIPDSIDGLPHMADIKDCHMRHRVAGRVSQIMDMGGSKFIFLTRDGVTSQIYVRKEVESAFKLSEFIQTGDIIGARGPIFQTKKGKVALKVEDLIFLTKALRGTGKVFQEGNDVKDKELLYRRRYLDMIMHPEVIHTFKQRADILKAIRKFLNDRDFIEVETRMLTPIRGGANAKPFKTHHNALDQDLYLRIAPELDLKRLIVGGMEKIYEIGRNFRNEGISKKHNPEFTSLEVYQTYATYNTMMTLVYELLFDLGLVGITNFITYEQAVTTYGEDWGAHLINPTFVTKYPIEISPLARPNSENPKYADRFELYINGMEIADGFSELNDPRIQRKNFEAQVASKNEEAMEMDEDFCRALEYGMPPTAGVGIGIDRLLMILLKKDNIKDVIPFPQYRDENELKD